jgi:putative phosphonate metabolism protein
MGPDARVAVYYAPRADDPLFTASTTWLGRNPVSGETVPQPAIPGIEGVTAEPRVYGFHATLKPPMRLAEGRTWADMVSATRELARVIAPFELPPLHVANLHGFLALRETVPCPPLQALADACVEQLDPYRSLPTEAELARRRHAGLSAEQDAMLDRWGYPYVLRTWFFHMTLTRRLSDEERAIYLPEAQRYFAHAIAQTRRVADICLFVQAAVGTPFNIAERISLSG